MRIIAAVDLSTESLLALRWALDLRDHARERGLFVSLKACSVTPSSWYSTDRNQKVVDDPSNRHRWAHQIRETMETVGDVDDVEILLDEGPPARVLADHCEDDGADWLIAGRTHGGVLTRFFQGSTMQKIARHAPCNVVLVHEDHHRLNLDGDLIVGIDFFPGSEAALLATADIAALTDSTLHLVHALSDEPATHLSSGLINYLSPTDIAHISASARASLESLAFELRKSHPDLSYRTVVQSGAPRDVLLNTVKAHPAQLLSLGRVRRSNLEELILGSTTRSFLKSIPTTLLLSTWEE